MVFLYITFGTFCVFMLKMNFDRVALRMKFVGHILVHLLKIPALLHFTWASGSGLNFVLKWVFLNDD